MRTIFEELIKEREISPEKFVDWKVKNLYPLLDLEEREKHTYRLCL